MQYKKMGRTGLKISELTLGTMIFGQQVDEAESLKIMDLAFEKGINSFDTADGYAGGRSEEIVGKALKNKRHAVVLASKVASKQGPGPNDSGLSREHILQAAENSLRRLGTDYLDIYYAHHPDPATPIEETLRAFDSLVQQGKVRYAACSNYRAGQLVRALAVSEQRNLARFDCIQTVYNLITRDIEAELLPTCADEGVGVVVYNPLAAGCSPASTTPRRRRLPIPASGRIRFTWNGTGRRSISPPSRTSSKSPRPTTASRRSLPSPGCWAIRGLLPSLWGLPPRRSWPRTWGHWTSN